MIEASADTFAKEVQEGKSLVLFSAEHRCTPCRALKLVLSKMETEDSSLRIVKINVDEDQKLAAEHGVAAVPVLVEYDSGQPTGRRLSGMAPPTKIRESVL